MNQHSIGENALRVWHFLNQTKIISLKDLSRRLNLSFEDLTLAVGWLARENKIFIEKNGENIYVSSGARYVFSFG